MDLEYHFFASHSSVKLLVTIFNIFLHRDKIWCPHNKLLVSFKPCDQLIIKQPSYCIVFYGFFDLQSTSAQMVTFWWENCPPKLHYLFLEYLLSSEKSNI